METLPDWAALQARITTVPRSSPGYTSNFFSAPDQVAQWCAAGRLGALSLEGALLVLRADKDFKRVHHVARDPDALAAALPMLPPGRYVTDLIGQGESLELLCTAYSAAGFAHHEYLRRMSRVQTPTSSETVDADMAEPADAPAVAAFLARLLDPRTDQLPDLDELQAAARDGKILLARRAGTVTGMLMYELKGQLAHLRFWHVDPEAQGAGVGRGLMASFLSRCAQARRIVLWVIGDNERSIAIYRHYGFAADGLLDRIMTLHKDPH